jgi:hypothetical protein
MAVQAAPGKTPLPPLTWWAAPYNGKSQHLRDFLQHALPQGDGRPRVVVLDNASIHTAGLIREAEAALATQASNCTTCPPTARI